MALFNFSKINGNSNEVHQDNKTDGGCTWKLWQIIVGCATIIGAIVGVIALILD